MALARLRRTQIFPEPELPDAAALIAEGRKMAETVKVGRSPFLVARAVSSEADYKRKCVAEKRIMMHAQIGFRDPDKSRRAFADIWDALDKAGYRVDRYGICLDWSMGYPRAHRKDMPRGTGLILSEPEDWIAMTGMAPVAPHFGDFVIGTPAAFENTIAALLSGSTSIGNLGQYFSFRQPHWDDDIFTTAESLKAIALTAAQPVEVIVHSNLDDGFASLFTDLSCSLGLILLEQYIVDELCGGHASYSFGNTFARPQPRDAFQCAAYKITRTPGTMIYGATTMYGQSHPANYAALATYLRVDIHGQRDRPAMRSIRRRERNHRRANRGRRAALQGQRAGGLPRRGRRHPEPVRDAPRDQADRLEAARRALRARPADAGPLTWAHANPVRSLIIARP